MPESISRKEFGEPPACAAAVGDAVPALKRVNSSRPPDDDPALIDKITI